MKAVWLVDAADESIFGGKATNLGIALRAGIAVPPGFAFSNVLVDAILREDSAAIQELEAAFAKLAKPVAVRSSAVGEDSADASFAGQHSSVLNVIDFEQCREAFASVVASSQTEASAAYRERLGIDGPVRMSIVMQELLNPDFAGVLFTRNPMSGVEERVIEAAWGLGEVVVSGLVIPDYYRLSAAGETLEVRMGEKDIMLRILPEGGTVEVAIAPGRANERILSDDNLRELHDLSSRCQSVYGAELDLEWCCAEGKFFLLQCRSITTASQ